MIGRIKQLAIRWRSPAAGVAALALAASLATLAPATDANASTGNAATVAAAQRQPTTAKTAIATTTTARLSGIRQTAAHEKHLIYVRWGMEHCLVGAYGNPGGKSLTVVIVRNHCGVAVQSYALCHVRLHVGTFVPRYGTINSKKVTRLHFRESGVKCPMFTENPGIWDYGFRINAPVKVDGHRPKPEWSPIYYFRKNAP